MACSAVEEAAEPLIPDVRDPIQYALVLEALEKDFLDGIFNFIRAEATLPPCVQISTDYR